MSIIQGDPRMRTCRFTGNAFTAADNESEDPIAVKLVGATASNDPYPTVAKVDTAGDPVYGKLGTVTVATKQVTVQTGAIALFKAGTAIDLAADIGKGIDGNGTTAGLVKAADASAGFGRIIGGKSTTDIFVDCDASLVV